MLTKVLLILLGLPIILPSRIEGTHVESEMGACAHHDDVYGPKPQYPKKKLPSEEIKPTAIDTRRDLGKLPAATQILDSILNNSDYKLRPGIGEKPTVVTVELSVNTLGPISIPDMAYSIDITFYQTWYDERLRFNGSFESFVLNGNMMSQLWIPDTFFRNSKKIRVYSITMHSQVVRIHKDGKVLYTDRMTIDAGCSFHMLKFPMDSHSCPLSFSSFSYPENEIMYKWKDFKLEINENNSWKLLQFDFIGVSNETEIISTMDGDFMVITLFFNVSRRFGFNAVQNYVPSSMTTVMSWISFWIKKESAPARTSLGITSVLTITTLGSCSQKNFPRESYVTALDVYIAICFLFCIFALVEFAVLNFLIHNHTRPRASPRLRYPPTRARACARARARDLTPPGTHANQQQQENVFVYDFEESEEENDEEDGPSCPAQQSLNPRLTQRRRSCCRICKYLCVVRSCDGSFWQQGRLFIHIYRLDNYSRVIFPVTFIFFNVLYWVICFNL
ncbi:gamma-aminobutyric acid receptor subunit epsilon [Myotis myotis]|uniref:Gamma-aminobutyric acid receptor subunit epsilon n=1 Tax=Myotis myotis TaxID=51298 RepID=A0A7J7YCQ7_MYOMY|nr:gamma-aminobutyric acid receptor subunit epsilon [Myotis myotis]KAF6359767.1 gamma-aminobutyric acid type A receptor subunit epsilon [Myotis myotis]